jgi:hypothetical protein
MKNKGLVLVLLAGGLILFMSMKKKSKGYKIIVPEPDKLTEEQFNKPSLFQRVSKIVAPVVKKAVAKSKEKRLARKSASVKGTFPDLC